MTDFFYWGGPVYCKQAKNLEWLRPTKVLCNPQEGSSNSTAFYGLGSDPLGALFRKAGLDPAQVGSIGFGGFSAFHQFLNPLLKIPAACERVDYVHLADSCFQGAGATSPHTGYVAFAKRAVAGKARMTVTTNGPWGKAISYTGDGKYAGQKFNLTSGAQCFELVWRAAAGELVGSAEAPTGIPQPTKTFRKGELYWFHYESGLGDPHGDHANVLAQSYMQKYGVPWMGGERGLSIGDPKSIAVGAIFAVLGWMGVRWYLGSGKKS